MLLATVNTAWGQATVVSDFSELEDALQTASDGDEIELGTTITLTDNIEVNIESEEGITLTTGEFEIIADGHKISLKPGAMLFYDDSEASNLFTVNDPSGNTTILYDADNEYYTAGNVRSGFAGATTIQVAIEYADHEEEITLEHDIELTSNIKCYLDGSTPQSLTITCGSYNLTSNGGKILIDKGVIINSDNENLSNILAPGELIIIDDSDPDNIEYDINPISGYVIVKTDQGNGVYAYTPEEEVTTNNVAKIKIGDTETEYPSLQAAIDAVPANGTATITLLQDVTEGSGIQIPDSRSNETLNITIDFNGKTYTVTNNLVGSANTKNQAMHFAGADNNLTLKNGTFNVGENVDGLKIMLQNYCNLTLDNFDVDCSNVPTQTYTGASYGEWEGKTRPIFNFNGGTSTITGSTITFNDTDQFGVLVDKESTAGSLTIGDGTTIKGNVTALGGTATIEDGATINGNVLVDKVEADQATGTITINGGTINGSAQSNNGVSALNIPTTSTATFPNAVALVRSTSSGNKILGAFTTLDDAITKVGSNMLIPCVDGLSFTLSDTKKTLNVYQDGEHSMTVNAPVPSDDYYLNYRKTTFTPYSYTKYSYCSKADAVWEYQFNENSLEYYDASFSGFSSKGTYKLLKDWTSTRKTVTANVTIDLNGKTWTITEATSNNNAIILSSSNITLDIVDNSTNKGGKIVTQPTANAALGISGDNNVVTIGEGVTIEGNSVVIAGSSTNKAENNTLTVKGTINAGNTFAIATNGAKTTNATINIEDGAVLTSDNVAVYLPSSGTFNITGGTITGSTGVYQKSGTLNISGGTINGTGAQADYQYNGDGANSTGDGVVIDNCGYPGGTPVTEITAGTFNSTNAQPIASYGYGTGNDPINKFVAGGTFNKQIDATYPVEGYECVSDGNGNYTIAVEGDYVARIGTTKYATLEAAFAAANDGETIELMNNISLTDRLFVNAGATPAYAGTNNRFATTTENKSITLDLKGYNITSSSNIALAGGSLNITNTGTADATHGVISTTDGDWAPIEVRGTGDITQKRTLTIGTGVTLSGPSYGLNVFGSNNDQKNTIDVNVNGTVKGMLFVLGNLTNAENAINIVVSGTVDASEAATTDGNPKTGIALQGNANVTVNDNAEVTGDTGIEVRAGNLTVNGGTITGATDSYSYTANGSGTTTKGAAVAVAQHTTAKPINVQLNGGTLVGKELIGVTDVNGNDLSGITVKAAESFVENTETSLPEGFCWKSNGDGTYSIAQAEAQIGNTIYLTLAEAVAAATTGQTVKLLRNITLTERQLINKAINIDGNGKTISSNVANPTTGYLNNNACLHYYHNDGESSDVNGSTLEIKNLTMQGFAYGINVEGNDNVVGATFNIENCTFNGRALISNWGDSNTFNVKECTVNGINNEAAGDDFACFVENTMAENNTYNLEDVTVSATSTAANQAMLALRGTGGTVIIKGTSTFVGNPSSLCSFIEDKADLGSIYFDEDAKDNTATGNFTDVLSQIYREISSEPAANNLYPIKNMANMPIVEIDGKVFWTLSAAFADTEKFGNHAVLTFLQDATLSEDITPNLTASQVFSMVLDGHTLTAEEGKHIKLQPGVSVDTDVPLTNILSQILTVSDASTKILSEASTTYVSTNGTYYTAGNCHVSIPGTQSNTIWSDAIQNYLIDNATIALRKDVQMADDLVLTLTASTETAGLHSGNSFTLNFKDGDNTYSLTGDKHIRIPLNYTVKTDVQTQVFASGETGYVVKETKTAEGYEYTLMSQDDAIAKIGDKYFPSLSDAIQAAGDGETIDLINDATLNDDVEVTLTDGKHKDNAFTLNLNDKSISGSGKILLPQNYTVNTNVQQTALFGSAVDGLSVNEFATANGYAYTLEVVARIGDVYFSSINAAAAAAQDGDHIVVLKGLNENEPLRINKTVEINKGVTLEGEGNQPFYLTMENSDADFELYKSAFRVTGSGNVTFDKMNLKTKINGYVVDDPTAENNGEFVTRSHNGQEDGDAKGIVVDDNYSGILTIINSVLTTDNMAVNVKSIGNGFALNVNNSTIITEATKIDRDNIANEKQLDGASAFDPNKHYINENSATGEGRAINFANNATAANVNITSTVIKGFAYAVNVEENSGSLNLSITDGTIYGRSAINNWGDGSTFTVENMTVHALSNDSSKIYKDYEYFAAFTDNKDDNYEARNNSYNIINTTVTGDCTIRNYGTADAPIWSSNTAKFIDLRGSDAKVKIKGSTTYTFLGEDTTRGGFTNDKYVNDMVDNNDVWFDETCKATFTPIIDALNAAGDDGFQGIRIMDDVDETNLYPLGHKAPKVILSILDDNGEAVENYYYETLDKALTSKKFGKDVQIQLWTDQTLAEDHIINVPFALLLNSEERFDDNNDGVVDRTVVTAHTINSDNGKLLLAPTVKVYGMGATDAIGAVAYDMTNMKLFGIAPGSEDKATILVTQEGYNVGEDATYGYNRTYTAGNVLWNYMEEFEGNRYPEGFYWMLEDLFTDDPDVLEAITDSAYVRLEMDLKLTQDNQCPRNTEKTKEQWYLDFNNHTLEANGHAIILKPGNEVYTTELTNIFASSDPEYTVMVENGENNAALSTYKNTDNITVNFPHKYYLMKDGLTVVVSPATYCGHAQEPTFIVKKKDADTQEWDTLKVDVDYTWRMVPATPENNYIDARTYVNSIIIEGITFQGTRMADFVINPRNINDCIVKGNEQPYNADGYDSLQIVNLIAAEYGCIVAEHNVNGASMTYTLKKKGDTELPADEKRDYLVSVTLPNGVRKLTEVGTYKDIIKVTALEGDYTEKDANNNNIVTKGTKNFVGSRFVDFIINSGDGIDIANVLVTSKAVYTSQAQTPSKELLEVTYDNNGTKVVLEPAQFDIEIHGIEGTYVDAKTYSNAITLKGTMKAGTNNTLKFYGTVNADYVIAPRDLADAEMGDDKGLVSLTKVADMDWTGNVLTPNINTNANNNIDLTMTYQATPDNGTYKLVANDYSYTIEPSPMTDPGEYKVIFTGRGNFTGMNEVKIAVLKNISTAEAEIALQVIPGVNETPTIWQSGTGLNPETDLQGVVIKDGDNVLVEDVHYTIVVKGESGTTYNASNPIKNQGLYYAHITPKYPYYTGDPKVIQFPAVFEYYTTAAGNVSPSENKFGIHVTSGIDKTATVGALNGVAVDADVVGLTIDPTKTIKLGASDDNKIEVELTINGIDDNAFNGENNLHYIDATALEGYEPTTLSRTENGPFNGIAKQAIVYLNGDDVYGENYVYETAAGDFRCDLFKIYDDVQGNQKGFTDEDYKWEIINKYEFTAATLTNTRRFIKDQHYTTCLPYDLPVAETMKAYTLTAASNNMFGFREIDGNTLTAFMPYVLIPSADGNMLSTTDVIVKKTDEFTPNEKITMNDGTTHHGYQLNGSTIYLDKNSEEITTTGLYIMQSGNQWKRIPADSDYDGPCVLPMRAYISYDANGGSREFMGAKFIDAAEKMATDMAGDDWSDAEVYDLQGRKVDTTKSSMRKGVYIVNGQKRIRK